MKDEDVSAPLLRVDEGLREKQLGELLLGPYVLGPFNVASLVLIREAAVQ